MRFKKLGPVRTYTEENENLYFSGSSAILLGFFFQPFFLVLGWSRAFVCDHPRGRRRDSRVASRSPGLHTYIQYFLFAPLHYLFQADLALGYSSR